MMNVFDSKNELLMNLVPFYKGVMTEAYSIFI